MENGNWRKLAAIDGHGSHASYKLCHEGSQEPKITVGGRKVVQYYHRIVVFQLNGNGFYLPLDAESVLPGEGKVAAAMRLATLPCCFDALTADAIHLRPVLNDMLVTAGKHLVATLRESEPGVASKSARYAELRQASGFTTDTIRTPLPVVHSHKPDFRHERVAEKSVRTPHATDWYCPNPGWPLPRLRSTRGTRPSRRRGGIPAARPPSSNCART